MFLDEDTKTKVSNVLKDINKKIKIKSIIEENDIGKELISLMEEIKEMNENISFEYEINNNNSFLPYTEVFVDDISTRCSFSGVPGGKEINSFVACLYHIGYKELDFDKKLKERIIKINKILNIQICVSLSCHHCAQCVSTMQQFALWNKNISAQMIDANLYPKLIEQYKIERVPLVLVNGDIIIKGAKENDVLVRYLEEV
ncbi:MAG: thioredoxin family protein [Eubacteriales bacterium]|nr:thioredoxin family protein [Eubacteriales bacterium]